MTRCPICKKPGDEAYRPFCSKRCADVDLAHWLRGDYAIPGEPVDPDAEDAPETEE
ncbi:DNA gyrase inhibitor YacG [Paracoccus jeotgali]|uniref:DNA gyrase inhibitor YacG n=1 Tax=Paracoccus jeotgali TaxID=2065379 RepID=UPI0028AEAC24|nr:DNA gyrase inhibitor YacG [Paracoccus jeotgali]